MNSTKTRDRSTKTRPQSAGELVEALTSGALDGRTRHAAAIVSARDVIDVSPTEAARALLVSGLASWAVAQAACLAELSRGKELLIGGELNPVLDTLQKVQHSILKLTSALAVIDERLEQRRNGKGAKTHDSVAALIADLN